jgi:hypothetical protein
VDAGDLDGDEAALTLGAGLGGMLRGSLCGLLSMKGNIHLQGEVAGQRKSAPRGGAKCIMRDLRGIAGISHEENHQIQTPSAARSIASAIQTGVSPFLWITE